jgi:hypothetical protein
MTKTSLTLLAAFLLAVLTAPVAALAQPWTAAPGAAVIDEQSTGIFLLDPGVLQYNAAGSTSQILAYYNVTDTSATGNPAWTTLELAAFDNSPNSFVRAQLYRLTPSSGMTTSIAACTSVDSSSITVQPCSLLGATVNFNAGYIYVLRITVSRTSTALTPMFLGARLY